MIAGIRPDMVTKVIDPPKVETIDDKELNASWVKFFLIFGGVLLASIILFIYKITVVKRNYYSTFVMVLFSLTMFIFVLAKFIKTRVILPKRFKSAIEKYGRENIIAQLGDSATFGFFVNEEWYNNLLILTKDYILGANEFVYALSDIREMIVSKSDINEERVKRMHDERTKNVLRCVYTMDLTLSDGSKRKEMFAISTFDMNPFFGYLNQRAPHIKIFYKNT
ncbi:MAG: hypothetical protein J5777_05010 [Clostridiales bacterium]|nr:hypothetical protein [Clostridiales bacterium]